MSDSDRNFPMGAATRRSRGAQLIADICNENRNSDIRADHPAVEQLIVGLLNRIDSLEKMLNTPEISDFAAGTVLEAQHQRARWGSSHDAGKTPEDWFWLLGYLGGKALAAHKSGDVNKALHHTISSAAILANWHAAISGADTSMRPGIEVPHV